MAIASLPASAAETHAARLTDSHGRVIRDLRVSITDRCNYKCVYCRTGEVGAQYPELGIDEYLRLIKLFVGLGIQKVRLTGGEPLLRRGLTELIEELARLRTLAGAPLDLALTTNGHLLDTLAAPLKAAGLNRATVSMDAVDEPTFERITRVPGSFKKVLGGIRATEGAGLKAPDVIGIGINGTDVIAELEKKEVTGLYGSLLLSPNVHGYRTTMMVYDWYTNKTPAPKFTPIKDVTLITRENFKQKLTELGMM